MTTGTNVRRWTRRPHGCAVPSVPKCTSSTEDGKRGKLALADEKGCHRLFVNIVKFEDRD